MIIRRIGLTSALLLLIGVSVLAQRHAYHLALHRQAKTIKEFGSINAAPVTPYPSTSPLVLDQFIAERSDQWIGTDAVWRPVDSLQYEYDAEGILLNVKTRLPDGDEWQYHQRIDFVYNAAGLLIQATASSWFNNSWQVKENDERIIWIYNEAEQTTAKEEQIWQNGMWQSTYRELYTYDLFVGTLLTFTGQNSIEGVWENDFEIRYTEYDDQQNLLTEEQYDWIADAWEPTIRIIRSYSAQNGLEELLVNTFIDDTWLIAYRRTYEYDSNGNLLQWLQESWQEDTQLWRSFFRELYERDEDGTLLSLNSQSWNTSDAIWRNVLATAYEYDDQNNNTLIYAQRWNSLLQDWENYFRTFLYYGDGLTATEAIESSVLAIKVFPNPSSDRMVIQYPQEGENIRKINVWSTMGKKIRSISVPYNSSGEIELLISNLPSGSYVLELITRKGSATHQIQVVK